MAKTAKARLTRPSVAKVAQEHLDRHQPRSYRLIARPDRVERIDGVWYVQVDPVPESASTGDFVRRMTNASMELDRAGLPVELTSILPCDLMKAEMLLPQLSSALSRAEKTQPKRRKIA